MRRIVVAALLFLPAIALAADYVKPYAKKDGTVVQGHYKSSPNAKRYDNFNAQNSVYGSNPYTGKKGAQRDEFSSPPAYNKPKSAPLYAPKRSR